MAAPLTLLLLVAVTIRAVLFRSSLAEIISERVEVVSPLNAWKRGLLMFSLCMEMLFTDGLFLQEASLLSCQMKTCIKDTDSTFRLSIN